MRKMADRVKAENEAASPRGAGMATRSMGALDRMKQRRGVH